jgi:hypothetical protein
VDDVRVLLLVHVDLDVHLVFADIIRRKDLSGGAKAGGSS